MVSTWRRQALAQLSPGGTWPSLLAQMATSRRHAVCRDLPQRFESRTGAGDAGAGEAHGSVEQGGGEERGWSPWREEFNRNVNM